MLQSWSDRIPLLHLNSKIEETQVNMKIRQHHDNAAETQRGSALSSSGDTVTLTFGLDGDTALNSG